MKKTLTAGGAVIALVLMPGVASAAPVAAAPVVMTSMTGGLFTQQTPEDPDDTDNPSTSPSNPSTPSTSPSNPSTTPSTSPSDSVGPDDESVEDEDEDEGDEASEEGAGGDTDVDVVDDADSTESGAITPGAGLSDEDGDGEPEKVDGVDDDKDGKVDEIDKKRQVSTVPEGGAETGDGSTGSALGMTLGGGAVLTLMGGLALWVRRALSRH